MEHLYSTLKLSFKDFYKNLGVIVPSGALLLVLGLFSILSEQINYLLQSNLAFTVWLVLFSIVSLGIVSYFLSGLIGISKDIVRRKYELKNFFGYANKFWFRTFLINVIILIVMGFVLVIALGIGKVTVPVFGSSAVIIDFLIKFLGLIGVIIFLAFANFYLVIDNLKIKPAIEKSYKFVKKNYLNVLTILVGLFIINWIISKLFLQYSNLLVDLINAIIIVPITALYFVRFCLEKGK